MTIAMPDSIYPDRLPPGYRAYLGYVDGKWATLPVLRQKFPGAHTIGLTVTGGTLDADGVDCEPQDPSAISAAEWIARKLAAVPGFRPVAYADLASPGYRMLEVLAHLAARGIARQRVRLLAAHYTGTAHICGPRSCGELPVDADGTQWTSSFAGVGGQAIDMSELADDFFGAVQTTVEVDVQLQVLKQGDSGQAVRNWQGLLVSHGYGFMIAPAIISPTTGGVSVEYKAGIDGTFGAKTGAATAKLQSDLKITGDPAGTVGAATWARVLA